MILGEDEIPRMALPKGHRARASDPDGSDGEAFVVTLPSRLVDESNAVWPTWLAPPGLADDLRTRISGAFQGVSERAQSGPSHPNARRSPLESPPPSGA